MTLIEAVRTGKPFRRAAWVWHFTPSGFTSVEDNAHAGVIIRADNGHWIALKARDVLAEDWDLIEGEDNESI